MTGITRGQAEFLTRFESSISGEEDAAFIWCYHNDTEGRIPIAVPSEAACAYYQIVLGMPVMTVTEQARGNRKALEINMYQSENTPGIYMLRHTVGIEQAIEREVILAMGDRALAELLIEKTLGYDAAEIFLNTVRLFEDLSE